MCCSGPSFLYLMLPTYILGHPAEFSPTLPNSISALGVISNIEAGATSGSGIEVVDANNDIAVYADGVSDCQAADEKQKTGRSCDNPRRPIIG